MTEPKHYRQAFKDLEKAENLAEELNRLALLLGTRRDGLNTANAQRAVSKAVLELVEARQQAKDNGYASLAVALKALGQKTPELELPEWALWAPAHWINETELERVEHWRKTKLYKKKAVTAVQAQKQLEGLQKRIKLVLDELEDRPDQQENVRAALMTLSYEDFSKELLRFLRGDPDEEAEEEETTAEQPDLELEAKVEELRAEHKTLGLEFDEEAARAALLVES